jgi:uncharacterized protein (DUF1778 family)
MPDQDSQTRILSLRVSEKIGKQFDEAAAVEGMAVSAWLREVGLAASYDILSAHRKKAAAQ